MKQGIPNKTHRRHKRLLARYLLMNDEIAAAAAVRVGGGCQGAQRGVQIGGGVIIKRIVNFQPPDDSRLEFILGQGFQTHSGRKLSQGLNGNRSPNQTGKLGGQVGSGQFG